MRASGMAVLTPLFSAAGVLALGSLVKSDQLRRKVYYPATIGVCTVAFAVIAYRYATSPYFRELSFQKIAVDMATKAGRLAQGYDAIFIERYVSNPYIYVAAFAPMSPREFQQEPKRFYSNGMDAFTELGKYHFVVPSTMTRTIDALSRQRGRFLFIAPVRYAKLTLADSVVFGEQKLYFQTF
jgi:hypothetical protein